MWTQWPVLVRDLDDRIVWRYGGGPNRALSEARELLSSGDGRGADLLESTIEELDGIHKGDRLYLVMRDALSLLTEHLRDRGELARGLYWCNVWVELDDRDLDARVRLAQLLYEEGASRNQAVQQLAVLHDRFPEVEQISATLVDMLLDQGREQEACQVLVSYLQVGAVPLDTPSGLQKDWRVFWDVGDGFADGMSKPVLGELSANGWLAMPFHIPLGARRLRIDLPPLSRLRLTEPRLQLAAGGVERTVNLMDLDLGLHDVTSDGQVLEVSSGGWDPYFTMMLPALAPDRDLQVTVRGGIASEPAPLTGAGPWEVFWDTGDGFNATQAQPVPMKIVGDYLELSFSVPNVARRLRMDPPSESRFRFVLPQLQINGATAANLWEIPLHFNQMSQDGHVLDVPGGQKDPFFSWAMSDLPGGQQLSITLQAQVTATPPSWAGDVLDLPGMEILERDLRASEDMELLRRLDRLRNRVGR